MKRKILSLITTLFLTLGVALSSCSNTTTSTHEHTYSSSYEYDDTYHWHPSTCGHDVQSEKELHIFASSVTEPTYEHEGYTTCRCLVCGYSYTDDEADKLEHNYSSTWSYDSSSHWHACTDDGYEHLKKDEGSHTFTTSVTNPTYESGGYTTYTCSTCGYSYTDDAVDTLPITITWENYDGTVLEVDNNVPYGTMPSYDGETPTKESDSNYDYIFAGWTPSVVIATQPTTYVATFSNQEITYTIDFDLNGGTSSFYRGPIEVKTFSKDIFFFDCVKEGWSFRGWEYQNEKIFDEKGNQLKNVVLVDNMIFKAIYTQTVKLTIVSNISEAGVVTGEGEYPYNTYVDVSATPNQGYKFIGWYYQGTLLSNTTDYKYMMWDQDITLEARFELDYFKMRVYSNSEEHGLVLLRSNSNFDYLPEYYEQRKYTSDVTIAAYSKTDVRFLGWYDENNQLVTTNAVYSFVMPNHDYTLQAKWNYFKIHYNVNGGINSENNPEYFDIDDNEIILSNPTRSDKDFIGWKYNGEFIDKIDSSIINSGKDITLVAVWSNYTYSILEDDNGDKYISITVWEDSSEELVIPETMNINGENIPIKEIGANAFKDNKTLKSVIMPDTIITIGESAFSGCSSIDSITIPDNVTLIGDHAFNGCTNLEAVTINDNSKLTTIGSYAFSGCSSLTSFYIPDSVTTIGDSTFYGCSSLTTVTISENSQLTSIGDTAFYNCSSLTSIYIPDSVTTIGSSAFYNCSNLIIYCEASLKPSGWDSDWNSSNRPVVWNSYLGVHDTINGLEYAVCADNEGNKYITIYGYNGSNTDVIIPKYIEVYGEQITVKEISDEAFYDNDTITSVTIPDSVTTIGDSAFYGCSSLTIVTISENSQLNSIGDTAFYNCSSLTSIYIPDSVTTIGSSAFYNCSNLIIYCEASLKPSGWDSDWNSSNRPVVWNSYLGVHDTINGLEYAVCADNEGNKYITIYGYNGSNTDVIIPKYIEVYGEQITVKEISDEAFYDNDTITSVTIPDSVTTIGDSAFYGCSSLTIVTISENSQLNSIGDTAFYNCSSLTSIYIPDSVTSIGRSAFYNCSNLTIYCEASLKPSGWNNWWNDSDCPVVWSCTYDEYFDTIAQDHQINLGYI